LIVPIIGIGLYPKVATQTYDVKTVEVAAHVREVLPLVAQKQANFRTASATPVYSGGLVAPHLPGVEKQPLMGVISPTSY
jgi:NAD(P)H-quinone oxidoreductase subunit 4